MTYLEITPELLRARPTGAISTTRGAPLPRHLVDLPAGVDVAPCVAPCPILRPDLANAMLPLINAHRAATNAHRAATVRGPLALDARLQACIEWKMLSCAGYQYLDHDDHGSVERTWSQRMAVYYPTSRAACGENIAYGFLDAQGVMDAFLSDAGHRGNVEAASWAGVGLAVAQAANGLLFWGQDYGSDAVPGPIPPPPPPPPPVPSGRVLDQWLHTVLPLIQATTQHQRWLAATSATGRADAASWKAFLANPRATPPAMRTAYGRSLVADLALAAAQG